MAGFAGEAVETRESLDDFELFLLSAEEVEDGEEEDD